MARSLIPGVTVLAALFLSLLAHSWYGPDIWYHLTWGRDIVSNWRFLPEPAVLLKQPIPANGYWLFQSIVYGAHQLGGIYFVSALYALLWLGTALLWLRLSRVLSLPLGLLLALSFVICMQLRFEHRPEAISYFFIVGMTAMALRGWLWPMVVAQVLWTNMHGFFVIGPLLAAAVDLHSRGNWTRSVRIALLLFAATLANPFGYRIYESVYLYVLLGRGLRDLNHELFRPPIWPLYWPTLFFWLSWLMTIVISARAFVLRQSRVVALLALVGVALSWQAMRNIPLLFLLSPLLWRTVRFGWRWPRVEISLRHGVTVAAAALLVGVWTGWYHRAVTSLATFGVRLEWASYPIAVAEFLNKAGFRGKVFADSYDGAFLLFHVPGITVAGDSYFSDVAQTRRFFAAIKMPEALNQLHKEVGFDAFVVNVENTEVLSQFFNDPNWVLAHADTHRALFLPAALNPRLNGDPAQFSYYHGEDLRHWVYEFGVVSWLAVAYLRESPELMYKIIKDLARAPAIPSTAFKIALKYASDRRDERLIQLLAPLKDRLIPES